MSLAKNKKPKRIQKKQKPGRARKSVESAPPPSASAVTKEVRDPEADFRRLLKALQNAAPGQLFFVQINSPVQRRELPERLKAEGLKAPYAVADFAKLPRSGNPCKVLDEFVKDSRQIEILYVEGLDLAIASHPYPGDAIEELSLGRELLTSLGATIVFLLPLFLIDLIRSQALNLWSWRAHDFNLDPIDRDEPLTDFRSFFERDDSTAPGDTPETRDRRIRILRRLYDQALAEHRIPESLVDPILIPLAKDLFVSGRYAEAEELYKRTLSICEQTHGPEHPSVATIWNNLGAAWDSKGDYDKAIEYFENALKSDLKTFGPEHPSVATVWDNLGGAWRAKGQYDKAIEYVEKALESNLKTFGPEHHNVARLWNNLGAAWDSKGDYDKAIVYYEKALAADLKTFGPEHPSVATCWNNLGVAWRAKGQYDEAIEYYEKALASDLKTFGPEHPSVATHWNNLGEAWRAKGDHGKAITYFEKALASAHKTLGPEHPHTLLVRRNLEVAKDSLEKTKKDRVSP